MTTGTRSAVGVSAAAILIGFLFGSAAFAQDSMQLDTMFRDSLSQGRDFQAKREDERRRVQERRYEARDADQLRDTERRSRQRHNEEGR
jgi:pentapeptide MXKDX repeat protein